jgi:hypothetical protein
VLLAVLSRASRALRRAAAAVDVVRARLGDEGALHGDDPTDPASLTPEAAALLVPDPEVVLPEAEEPLAGSLAARARGR